MLDLSALDKIDPGTRLDDLNKTRLAAVQRGLAICAHPLGEADGLIGPKTRNAFAELVQDIGNGHPSVVSDAVIDHLKKKAKRLRTIFAMPADSKDDVKDSIAAMFRFIGLGLKAQIAYGLATAQWETGHTFEPVKEAYWLSEKWRRDNFRYYPYYGRGYVQLTWENNYKVYSSILGLDLVGDPDLALRHDASLFTIAHGMKIGTFTGRKLEDYVSKGKTDFLEARRVINGTDKQKEIADLAEDYLDEL